MIRLFVVFFCLLASSSHPSSAFDFAPVATLDVSSVDPSMMSDVYGKWEIRNSKGTKICHVTLLKEPGIGGGQIEFAHSCSKHFPVLSDISAWRLNEGWSVDFIDVLRQTRIRFETPDERYVAFGDGKDISEMDEFNKLDN